MLHIVLFQPEIPPNTGNVIRLCANNGFQLHLIEPLGFIWDDKRLLRAGLDYHEFTRVQKHPDLASFESKIKPERMLALSTRGQRSYHEVSYQPGDALLFGPETRGLPDQLLQRLGPENTLRIPMVPPSRSMNLSNSVAIVAWEAWRQHNFLKGQ